MSRFGDYDGDDYANGGDLWTHRAHLALSGKRGRKALGDLRDALLALPDKRLIEGALCTVGLEDRLAAIAPTIVVAGQWRWLGPGEPTATEVFEGPFIVENPEIFDIKDAISQYDASQGEGVCAIGAYVWWQKVKSGMDPAEAFASVSVGGSEYDTTDAGKAAGLTFTLAWELANRNDELWGSLSPEQRYVAFLKFIDTELARPPLTKPAPKPKRQPRAKLDTSRLDRIGRPVGTVTLGL